MVLPAELLAMPLIWTLNFIGGTAVKSRPGEDVRTVEDNCNNLALAKVAGIARMPYNPLVFQCKEVFG